MKAYEGWVIADDVEVDGESVEGRALDPELAKSLRKVSDFVALQVPIKRFFQGSAFVELEKRRTGETLSEREAERRFRQLLFDPKRNQIGRVGAYHIEHRYGIKVEDSLTDEMLAELGAYCWRTVLALPCQTILITLATGVFVLLASSIMRYLPMPLSAWLKQPETR